MGFQATKLNPQFPKYHFLPWHANQKGSESNLFVSKTQKRFKRFFLFNLDFDSFLGPPSSSRINLNLKRSLSSLLEQIARIFTILPHFNFTNVPERDTPTFNIHRSCFWSFFQGWVLTFGCYKLFLSLICLP